MAAYRDLAGRERGESSDRTEIFPMIFDTMAFISTRLRISTYANIAHTAAITDPSPYDHQPWRQYADANASAPNTVNLQTTPRVWREKENPYLALAAAYVRASPSVCTIRVDIPKPCKPKIR